jgi:hypothetical protein
VNIKLRVIENAEAARNAGWTKNHRLVEMFVVGKWRAVGFFTEKQIDSGKAETEARKRIGINAPNYPKDLTFTLA